MLFNLLYPLADQFGLFNLFRYITFRTGGAVLTALVISFVVGPGADPLAARAARARASRSAPTARPRTWSASRARRPWAAC